MEHNVLSAPLTPIGMERLVSLVMVEDCGTHLILSVNVLMKLNGTVSLVSRPVTMEKFLLMVSVSALKDNSNKKENASTTQLVKLDSHGMEKNVLVYHVSVVPHTTQDVDVVKPQSSPAQLVPIGMVTDVFMLLTSVLLVWFGKTTAANQTHQNVLVINMNSMDNVFLFQLNAHQALLGTPPTAVLQLQTLAQLDHITMEPNVSHINHAPTAESGTILFLNVFALRDHSLTVKNVLNVLQVSFMLRMDVIVQLVHSLMDQNVHH